MSSGTNAEGLSEGGILFAVDDYDLDATLGCGQAFRWERGPDGWQAVVAGRWVRVRRETGGIRAWAAGRVGDWGWLGNHLALDEDLAAIVGTFPSDAPMQAAKEACRGLRLLRQEPWECLASFIASSNKQIVQIRQIVRSLSERLGDRVESPDGTRTWHAFPGPDSVVAAGESSLRACRMGYRAPFLLDAAARVLDGRLDLQALWGLPTAEARTRLMEVEGVGPKIADCVLLFAYGRQDAFPIDVWVRRALTDLYFPKVRRLTPARLERFSATHFGPFAGYAQQYLFHHVRKGAGKA